MMSMDQVESLFRALEWAGREDGADGGFVPVCLVCGEERHGLMPFSGHASYCIYAEVFYK